MKLKNLMLLALCALPQASIASGGIGIANLPISSEHDNPVCYDETNGMLGNCTAGAMRLLENLVWVAKNGTGEYDDPIQAINDIDSWCPDRSVANRCVIRIAPGVWEMGSTPITLLSWVHIQGSGSPSLGANLGTDYIMGSTIIKGTVTGLNTGVIVGAYYSSMSDLVVVNESTGTRGVAIYQPTYYLTIKNVYAKAVGSTNAYGLVVSSTPTGGATVTAESSTFVGEGVTKSRGIYVSNINDFPANVTLRDCDVHTRSGSDALGILLEAYPPTNKNFETRATIRHSRVRNEILARGDGWVNVGAEHSNIKSINNLGTGISVIKCAFLTSGVLTTGAYSIHTDTCP